MALAHLLSLSRIALGALILLELVRSTESPLVLPTVVAACASDFVDGPIARRRGIASPAGRLLDNLCDGAFLALSFSGFALAWTWSLPLVGSATRYWIHANWLPVFGLGASFGSYMLRWGVSALRGRQPQPSSRGHAAGVANYVLAILGGVAVFPSFSLTPWILEPAFATVVLLNLSGAGENLVLLVKESLE